MAVYVGLLYSVVLPGSARLHMQDLRDLAEGLGFEAVRTVGSTGNLIFATPLRSVPKLERLLETAFEQRFGKHVDIIIRTAAEIGTLAKAHPFAPGTDPATLTLRLLRNSPLPDLLERLLAYRRGEDLALVGRDLWIRLTAPPEQSRIPAAFDTTALAAPGTFRSWPMIRRIGAALEPLRA